MYKRCLRLTLLVLISLLPQAVVAQQCPTLPPDSPTLSASADDVPGSAGALLINTNGAYFKARPNHVMAFVQTGPNEQMVWFSTNSTPQYSNAYYNRRYRASDSSPWYWQFSESQPVLAFPDSSLTINATLYSPSAKYGDGTGALYKFVMYAVYQPHSCDGVVAGFATASFSNNGTCWTAPRPLTHQGGPSAACAPQLGANLVQVESFDAIDGGSAIYLMGIEGNVSQLVNTDNMNTALSYWGTVAPGSATVLQMTPGLSIVNSVGIVSPAAVLSDDCPAPNPVRWKPYLYLINMAMAWDAANGDLYVTRGYPYPMDRGGSLSNCDSGSHATVPSFRQSTFTSLFNGYLNREQQVTGTEASPATFPNRIQIYKMHLSSLANFERVAYTNWTLVADYGAPTGYEYQPAPGYGYPDPPFNVPLVDARQQSVGQDYGAGSFLRDGSGSLVYSGSSAYVFGGTTLRSNLAIGIPSTTGNERVTLIAIPH